MKNELSGKRVLCLFPRFYIGGVSKALSFVANICDEVGMEVHCVALKNEPETIHLNEGIHRYVYDVIGKSGWRRILHYGLFLIRFRYLVRKIHPNVIIVFRADLVKAVVNITTGMNIPVIGSERGNPLLYGKLLDSYRRALARASAIVYQTEAAREVYGVDGKCAIIPNPAITRHSNIIERKIKEGRNIITVSRLSKEKNIGGLLRAFAMIHDKIPDRKLILYGDGDERADLERLADELGIGSQLVFAGNVNDFTTQADNASIFVLNTLSEGMPNALIEAMITGYACICTDCPIGAPRWLSDGGRRVKLVPVGDDKSLGEAMLEIATNEGKAKRLAKSALEINDILSPERIGGLWLKLIKEVIHENMGNN